MQNKHNIKTSATMSSQQSDAANDAKAPDQKAEDYMVIQWTLGGKRRTVVLTDKSRAEKLFESLKFREAPFNDLLSYVEIQSVVVIGDYTNMYPHFGLDIAYLREHANNDAAETDVKMDRHVLGVFAEKGIKVQTKCKVPAGSLCIAVDNWADATTAAEIMLHTFSSAVGAADTPAIESQLLTPDKSVFSDIEHAYIEGFDKADLINRAVARAEAYKVALAAKNNRERDRDVN
jgi:hypothetical protein